MPSVASLFTSRYQSQHGITEWNSALSKAELTLAEALESRGYLTGGFSGNWGIRPELGYGQGFEHFQAKKSVDQGFRQEAERATQTGMRLLNWLNQLEPGPPAPLFLYLHVMDPHIPYNPPLIALKQTFAGNALPNLKAMNDKLYNKILYNKKGTPLSKEDMETIERLYDAEVISADLALSALFAQLEDRGLLDNSLIIFMADHGEEFWDHGSIGHAHSLYDEVIRVPLFIHMPGQTTRVDVQDAVALVDIAPTVLDFIGSVPVKAFEGRSLEPILLRDASALKDRGIGTKPEDDRPPTTIISELIQPDSMRHGTHERAILIDSHKFILDVDGEKAFFDQSTDAEEKEPTSLSNEDRLVLEQALDDFLAHVGERATSETKPMDQETLEQLRALGYVK